jgi:hypothetical protein
VFQPMRRVERPPLILLLPLGGVLVEKCAYAYIDPTAQGLLVQTVTPTLILGATCVAFLRSG